MGFFCLCLNALFSDKFYFYDFNLFSTCCIFHKRVLKDLSSSLTLQTLWRSLFWSYYHPPASHKLSVMFIGLSQMIKAKGVFPY